MRHLALLLAVTVGTALSFVLAGCSGDDSEASPKAGAAATRSTPAATTGGAQTQRRAQAAPVEEGPLEPGTYDSGPSFRPSLRLRIDEPGWRALFPPDDDELALEHEDGRFLAFTRVTRVVDPKTGQEVPAPRNLAEWLATHPALQPTQSAPASVGGAGGTRIDTPTARTETNLFSYPTGSMHTARDVRWRVFVLDVHGTPLTIVSGAPAGSFDDAVAKLGPLLASVEFD